MRWCYGRWQNPFSSIFSVYVTRVVSPRILTSARRRLSHFPSLTSKLASFKMYSLPVLALLLPNLAVALASQSIYSVAGRAEAGYRNVAYFANWVGELHLLTGGMLMGFKPGCLWAQFPPPEFDRRHPDTRHLCFCEYPP